MDIDLKKGWEKKALIIVAVVVIIILAYAFNPFKPAANYTVENPNQSQSVVTTPTPTPATNNSTNTTKSNNITTLITADQAKAIAESANKGYKASEPMQGTVVVNGTTAAVWIVPLKSGTFSSKTSYVDITTGRIVQET